MTESYAQEVIEIPKIVNIDLERLDHLFINISKSPKILLANVYKLSILPLLLSHLPFPTHECETEHFELQLRRTIKPKRINKHGGPLYEIKHKPIITKALWNYINKKFLRNQRAHGDDCYQWERNGFDMIDEDEIEDWEVKFVDTEIICLDIGLYRKHYNV